MNDLLNNSVKTTRVINATAAGTTDINGTVIDMSEFDGVRFVAMFGALTATQVTNMKAQQGDQSDGSDAADIPGAVTANLNDADSNKVLILDVSKNMITKRYIRCVVDRGTANAVVDGVIADQYIARKKPTLHGSTVSNAKNVI